MPFDAFDSVSGTCDDCGVSSGCLTLVIQGGKEFALCSRCHREWTGEDDDERDEDEEDDR